MKLVHYRVERLNNPDGEKTHQLIYESISKNKSSGGYGMGIVHKGSFRECHDIKKEIEDKNERKNFELLNRIWFDNNETSI